MSRASLVVSLSLTVLCLGPACSGADDDDDDGEDLPSDAVAAEFLEAHNAWRDTVEVPHLAWDGTVAQSALGWAEALAEDGCAFEHENQQTYGENLWWSSYEPSPTEVVDAWGGEVVDYDYDSNTCAAGRMCGHYTQIVWADTEVVGCGMGVCSGGEVIWACRYDPPGNWVGERPY